MREGRTCLRRFPAAGLALAIGAGLSLAGCGDEAQARPAPGGQAERGKQLIAAYGCGSCHTIPGVDAARGLVGPPLTKFARRVYIAGEVPNTNRFLVQWITVPQSIEPGTAMPNLGVTEGEARDIAAYLYTLR
jgi:cytochrome c1